MARRVCKPCDISVDVAVVGAGLSGLALARNLLRQGRDVSVFEARSRVGGRIAAGAAAAQPRVDLGPTWYWPKSQPLMSQLVRDLGQRDFAQLDSAEVLVQSEPNQRARQVQLGPVHSHARRIQGGMSRLVETLASELPAERVHLRHVLTKLRRRGQQLELHFECDGETKIVHAARAVLALPPRLIAERVSFEPALDSALQRTLEATPTWMATSAKVALWYERAEWRPAHSGNAFIVHADAVLKEIFDASEEPCTSPALGAFLALSPEARRSSQATLASAIDAQVAQVFELTQPARAQLTHDWSAEPYTCSQRDLREHRQHQAPPTYGAAELQRSRWDKRLYFGASETADVEGGYLEGALRAARRIAREISRLDTAQPKLSGASRVRISRAVLPASPHHDRLSQFHTWLHEQRRPLLDDYQKRVALLAPSHDSKQVTQRALLASVQQLLQTALEQFQAEPMLVHPRRDAALAPRVHEAMREFLGAAMRDVLAWNRSAPLLSDHREERQPSRNYAQAMMREVYAAYRRFARDVSQHLANEAAPPTRAADSVDPTAAAS